MNESQTQIYGLHSTQSSGVNNDIQTDSLSQSISGNVYPLPYIARENPNFISKLIYSNSLQRWVFMYSLIFRMILNRLWCMIIGQR